MKISSKTIDYLKDIITGDSQKSPYLSGPQLVKFFNELGWQDIYGQVFPARLEYTKRKLLELNQLDRIEEIIEYYYSPIHFIEDKERYKYLIKELNEYLAFDDLELVIMGKIVKLTKQTKEIDIISEASFSDNTISIVLQKNVFDHVKTLLNSGHYYNAVEESYKIVREKLKSITGEEQAHKAFKENNCEKIFGHEPQNDVEKDFFEGVKYLHMAIQNLRNEKAHTPAKELDKNLAIHYIVLASLAYDLINI